MMRAQFAAAQRQLRKFRALDVLGQSTASASEARFRDQLLPEIFEQLARENYEEGNIDLIEAAVSVGVSRVNESTIAYVAAILAAAETLSRGGQFARLRPLAGAFRDIADKLESERPFLAATLQAYGDTVKGSHDSAARLLSASLGLEGGTREPILQVDGDRTAIIEVAIANAFRYWLVRNDAERLQAVRQLCESQGDGLLFALASLLISHARSDGELRLTSVVSEFCEVFRSERLRHYLATRGIRTLFPAQSAAIKSGLLEPGNQVVGMPTSSGKTLLAELRIAAELTRIPGRRVIYLSPYRLLARQVANELRSGLRVLNVNVQDLGSSYDFNLDEIPDETEIPDVAVMTFERMDAMLRLADSDRNGTESASELKTP